MQGMALLAALPNGDRPNNLGKKKDGGVTTWRFDLALEDPTDEKTNEFSYVHLVNDAMKKRDTPPVEDDGPVDSKLLRIAKELEEKYGSAVKKRRIVHDADYADLGYGYDTSDSFVDDADAVDDFVPPGMDTEFGGFYINTGDLEYKQSKDTEIDDLEFAKSKKKPKISRQPSHSTPQTLWANKKLKLAKQQVASAKKLKLPVLMRKSSSDSNKGSATPVLKGERKRRPKSEKEGAKKPRQQPQQSLLAQFESLTPSNSDQPYANTEGSFPMQGSQSTEALTQPLLESVERQLLDDVGGSVEVFGSLTAVGGDAGAQQGGVVRGLPPPLPPGVPADLTKMIEDLTSAVSRETSGEKKMTQKTRMSFDAQLMEVEKVASKFVPNKVKVGINDHLAAVFGVSRSSLTSRTRKLMKKRDEDKMTIAMDKLKQAVDERMKVQLKRYEEELAAAASIVAGTSDLAVSSAGGGSGGSGGSESEALDTDTAEKMATTSAVLSGGDEESQGGSGPQGPVGGGGQQAQQKAKKIRKHFKWDADVKQLLIDVVKVKLEKEQVLLQKHVNIEGMLMQFLDESVKPLWPKGWMFKGILMRTSEPAYKHLLPQKDAGAKPIAQLQPPPGAVGSISSPVTIAQLQPSPGGGSISSPVTTIAQLPQTITQVPKTIAQAQLPTTRPMPTAVVQGSKVVAQLHSVAPDILGSLQSPLTSPKVGQSTTPEQRKDSRSHQTQVIASADTASVKVASPTVILPGGIKVDLSPSIPWGKLVAHPQAVSTSLADPKATATMSPRSSAPSTSDAQTHQGIAHSEKSKIGVQAQPVGGAPVQQVGGAPVQQVGGAPVQQVGSASEQRVGGAQVQQVGGTPVEQVVQVPAQQVGRAPMQQVGGAPEQRVGGAQLQQVGGALVQQVGRASMQQVGGTPVEQVVQVPAQQVGRAPMQQVGGALSQAVVGTPKQLTGQTGNAPVQVRKVTPLPLTGGAPMRSTATQRQRMTPTQQVRGSPAQQVVGTQEVQARSTSHLDLVLKKIITAHSSTTSAPLGLHSEVYHSPSTALQSAQGAPPSHSSTFHPTASTSEGISMATTIATSPMATQIMAEHSYQGNSAPLVSTVIAGGVSVGTIAMATPSVVRQATDPSTEPFPSRQ